MGDGHVVVTAIRPIELADITESLARQCGFEPELTPRCQSRLLATGKPSSPPLRSVYGGVATRQY